MNIVCQVIFFNARKLSCLKWKSTRILALILKSDSDTHKSLNVKKNKNGHEYQYPCFLDSLC